MPRYIDISGQRFNMLTVLRYDGRENGSFHSMWECVCDCGKVHIVSGYNLKRGSVKSCGCLQAKNGRKLLLSNTYSVTHGKSRTPEYKIWIQMRKRCTNPKDRYFHVYGGRGINVCNRWMNSFQNFIDDVGYRPSPKHSIDRYPNKNGNYEPGNIRWATMKEQQNNRSNNNIIYFSGQKLTLSQWSEKTGIKSSTIRERIRSYGWTVEKALTT